MEIKVNGRFQRRASPKKAFTISDMFDDGNCRVAWDNGSQGYLTTEMIEDTCEPAPPRETADTPTAESSWMEPDDPPALAVVPHDEMTNGNGKAPPLEQSDVDGWRLGHVMIALEGVSVAEALHILESARDLVFRSTVVKR